MCYKKILVHHKCGHEVCASFEPCGTSLNLFISVVVSVCLSVCLSVCFLALDSFHVQFFPLLISNHQPPELPASVEEYCFFSY
jgi:hypothetical protein